MMANKDKVDVAVLAVGGVLAAGTAVTLYPAVRQSMGFSDDYVKSHNNITDMDKEEVQDQRDMECFADEP